MKQTAAGTWPSRIAAAGAVATLALAAVLALPALRGPAPAPPAAEAAAAQGSRQLGDWLVEAAVNLLPDRGYRIDVRLTRTAGAPPPDRLRPVLILSMDGMQAVEPPLLPVGGDDYRAEGRFPMTGRWKVSVGLEEGMLDLVVDPGP